MTSWPRSTASSPPSTPAIRQPPRWSGACAPSAASALWCPPCWPPFCSASRFATPMHWSPMSAWTRVLMNPAAAAAVVDCPNAGTPSGAAFWSPPPCPPRARASGATMSWATKTKDCPQQPYTSSSRARCCGSPSPSTNPATTSSRRKSNLFDNNHRIFRGDDGIAALRLDPRIRGDDGIAEPARCVERVIGEDRVGARALHRRQHLEHRRALVERAGLRGRLQHRVFAGDLVDRGRHAERVLHAAHDVEVRQPGLDHHHVGAFADVEPRFPQRLVAVGGIHLVRVLVAAAERRRGADGVTERAVEARCVFRR